MITNICNDLFVLGIDTSSSVGALGLMKGDAILGEMAIPLKGSASEKLLPAIDRLLDHSGVCLADVGLFAVTKGPGSFTGLRIGLATVKGLAYTHDSVTVGVESLEVLAAGTKETGKRIVAVLPARPEWVYSAMYKFDNGILECIEDAVLENVEDLAGRLIDEDHLIGEGALKYKNVIEEIIPGLHIDPDPKKHCAKGSSVSRLGLEAHMNGNTVEQAEQLEPLYLQASMAEIKWKERQYRQ